MSSNLFLYFNYYQSYSIFLSLIYYNNEKKPTIYNKINV